jgi:hypothetical protein
MAVQTPFQHLIAVQVLIERYKMHKNGAKLKIKMNCSILDLKLQ